MLAAAIGHPWAFTFGILGNLISFMVYLAPLPTFRRVRRNKSTEGFQPEPYVVALFSAMLWIYYAILKPNDATLLITINSFGCFIEIIYITLFLIYAPRSVKIFTAKLLLFLNVALFGVIILLTLLLSKGSNRAVILGWICVAFSVCVFVAPLSIIRLVVRTKSVEYMPFYLSLFLTVSAIVWFTYGFLLRDIYVAIPNILGFIFGVVQMGLYAFYKNANNLKEAGLPEHIITIMGVGTGSEVYPIDPKAQDPNKESKGQDKECELTNGVGKEGVAAQDDNELSHCEV